MDFEQVRLDTPACEDVIHFNNAGASLPPASVTARMIEYLQEEARVGGYELAAMREKELGALYTEAAKMLHCRPDNIAFATNATEAFGRALLAIPFEEGDTILTTDDDYISNQIAFMSLHKRYGIRVLRAENLPSGDLNLDHLNALAARYRPRLIAVTHIPTNSGKVLDAEAVGRIARAHEAWYLLDACQSYGQYDLDVPAIGCDFLSATGRKFMRGPRGTGMLYVSDRALESGLEMISMDMRGADWVAPNEYRARPTAQRFEQFEFSHANAIGLAEAIRYANAIGLQNIETVSLAQSQHLRERLRDLEGVRILDEGAKLCNIITFVPNRISVESLAKELKANKVNFSVSTRANALLDFTKKGVEQAIRLSPHYYNSREECDAVWNIVRKACQA